MRCAACGRFIAFTDMESGKARFEHEPDSDRSTERSDWICARCAEKETK